MQAFVASGLPKHRNLELVARQIANMRLAAAIARAEAQAIADAYDNGIASCNALPLMSHAGDEGKAATGQLHSYVCADGNAPAPILAHDASRPKIFPMFIDAQSH